MPLKNSTWTFVTLLTGTRWMAALADPNPQTALNLFGDGDDNNPATIESLRTTRSFSSRSFLKSLNLTANGPLFRLPSGSVRLRAGADYREQAFSSATRTALTSPVAGRFDGTHSALGVCGGMRPACGGKVIAWSRRGNSSSRWAHVTRTTATSAAPSRRVMGSNGHPCKASRSGGRGRVRFAHPASWTSTRAPTPPTSPYYQTPRRHPGRLRCSCGWARMRTCARRPRAAGRRDSIFSPHGSPGSPSPATYFKIDFRDRLSFPGLDPDLLTNARFADMVTRNPTAAQLAEVCSRAPISTFTPCASARGKRHRRPAPAKR